MSNYFRLPWALVLVAAGVYSYALFRLLLALFGWAGGIGSFFRCMSWGALASCAAAGSGAVWAWTGVAAGAVAVGCVCGWVATTWGAAPGEAPEDEETEEWGVLEEW